jgi:DNA-binding HxlR family transcriptional regulator
MNDRKEKLFEAHKNVRVRKATSTNAVNKIALERDCPIAFTISAIGGRWKLSILALLKDHGPLRYSEIKSKLPGISERILTLQLKELEQFSLVSKKLYAEVPARSEYSLSAKGKSLETILEEMTKWGEIHRA